ncbi:MAG: BMP family ABC transporter substrate-binding protein [Clostridiales bacterium]|nr:BMP family ABC transporter substrate-binding protein [Clostridiales bacterium]
MKKFLTILTVFALVLTLVACGAAPAAEKPEAKEPAAEGEAPIIKKVALVTDVGTIDDESFNQACWQGVKAWSEANKIDHKYYQPTEDSNDARMLSISQAIQEGANVVVLPGFLFDAAVAEVQDQYPDVYFIAVDVASLPNDTPIGKNAICITFAEEQAGFLAGYAAVKDGYTKHGFLGGMAVPAVVRFGYGYVQGADLAAQEMETDIEIKYFYGGQFFGDANITARMEGWYKDGTEVVFACGGGIYTSAVDAALQYDGKVIGVDVDQFPVGEKEEGGQKLYKYNPFISSAMKGLQPVTEAILEAIQTGKWEEYSGKSMVFSLAEGDFVGLPTTEESWGFATFTLEDYEALIERIKSGEIEIDNSFDTAKPPTVSEFTKLEMIS